MNILNYISELNDLKNNLIYEDKLEICKVYEIEEWIVAAKLFFHGITDLNLIALNEIKFIKKYAFYKKNVSHVISSEELIVLSNTLINYWHEVDPLVMKLLANYYDSIYIKKFSTKETPERLAINRNKKTEKSNQ